MTAGEKTLLENASQISRFMTFRELKHKLSFYKQVLLSAKQNFPSGLPHVVSFIKYALPLFDRLTQ